MAVSSPPTTIPRRSFYEFRRLWELHRVRVFAAIFNLAGVAWGIYLAAGETGPHKVRNQILVTVGALAIAVVASIVLVWLLAAIISPHRILKDRVAALEGQGAASAVPAAPQVAYNIQAEHVSIAGAEGKVEPPLPTGQEQATFETPPSPQAEDEEGTNGPDH